MSNNPITEAKKKGYHISIYHEGKKKMCGQIYNSTDCPCSDELVWKMLQKAGFTFSARK